MWQTYVMQYLDSYLATGDYTLTQWERMCNVAVQESIDNEYGYVDGYTITTTGNIESWTVSPDPSTDATFIKFISHKVWCNIYQASIINHATNASMVEDGTSRIDTRNALPSMRSNFDTPCDIFNKMLNDEYGDLDATVYINYNFAAEDT